METQRIKIGSIDEIVERLNVAQKFGYKNLYLEIDKKEDIEESHDSAEEEKNYGTLKTEYYDTYTAEEIVRFSLDCDNIFLVKDVLL